MSNNEKPDDIHEPLEFLSPRLRELLRRLATADRREELQELAWMIEGYAKGRLRDQGDGQIIPRVPLDGLPETLLVEKTRVRRVKPSASELDSPQSHEEDSSVTVPPESTRPTKGSGA